MRNYQNSKIYKIEPIIDHEEHEIYIGSTTKYYLSQRMDSHRRSYNSWKKNNSLGHVSVYDIFDSYGVENCRIYLIENYPCNSSDELFAREGHFIRQLACCNKLIAGRSQKQYREDHKEQYSDYFKQYYMKNKDKKLEIANDYYQNNKDHVKQNCKKYRDCHKETISDYQKAYREENKEKLKLYKKQYYENKKLKDKLHHHETKLDV